jgi:hypothetical protein
VQEKAATIWLAEASRPIPLKTPDFPDLGARRPFFAAQRNTPSEPVLGIDGLSRLKKRNFLLKSL